VDNGAKAPGAAFDLLEAGTQRGRLSDAAIREAQGEAGKAAGAFPRRDVLSGHTDEDGAMVFRQACAMGLEGIVSKRLAAPYRSGPVTGLAQGQESGQPGDGETSVGAIAPQP
jgi:ATP-dependent DNA ligase